MSVFSLWENTYEQFLDKSMGVFAGTFVSAWFLCANPNCSHENAAMAGHMQKLSIDDHYSKGGGGERDRRM
jgi:hypothetical protein